MSRHKKSHDGNAKYLYCQCPSLVLNMVYHTTPRLYELPSWWWSDKDGQGWLFGHL